MIFDLHNDLLILKEFKPSQEPLKFDPFVVYPVWTTMLKDPAGFISAVAERGQGQPPMLSAIEDLGFLADGGFIRDDGFLADGGFMGDGDFMSGADLFLKKFKPVYASLTWNGENAFAGGADTDAGLSLKGEKMIALLENTGILLDVAHLSRTAFFAAASIAKKPFICSHTCFDGVIGHRRNLDDGQIKTLIAKDGLIGLCLVSEFMGKPQADTGDVVRQIDYFVQRFGDKNLGIGTDFNGCDHPALKDYADFEGLAERLAGLGYTQKSIDKIFYSNVRDFLAETNKIRKVSNPQG